ncbi:hypothetical protein BJ508DRAFT_303070 [Ascobolus immersus RN42]|uniref:Protein kinase domain-containing protein n=1 Tax=Ascobolus immersus RN42 TaxID=1160509 RepID=A0A3N4IHU2_ASCIM|nr:hypothetical protein BJ508DRAFT_303070 [Ascobolus immersus RN42]
MPVQPPSSGVASPAAAGYKLGTGANTSAGGSSSRDFPKSSIDQQQQQQQHSREPGSSPAGTTTSTASPSTPDVSVVANDNGNAHLQQQHHNPTNSTTAPAKPGLLLPSLMASEKNHLNSSPSTRSPSTPLQSSRPASPSMGGSHSKHGRSASTAGPQSPNHLSPTTGSGKKINHLFERTKLKLGSMRKGHHKTNSVNSPTSPSSPKSPLTGKEPQAFPRLNSPTREQQTLQLPQTPTSSHTRNTVGSPRSPGDKERNWDPRATSSSFQAAHQSGSLNDPSDIGASESGALNSSYGDFGSSSSVGPYRRPGSPGDSYYRNNEEDEIIERELGVVWILNLSMHYRENAHKEKFFVTYRTPSGSSRRITVSVNYRDAEPKSLEDDLRNMRFQKDKSGRIYRAIRNSLRNVQFFDTATNLRLHTIEGALHINVSEDINEVIPYPPISVVQPIKCRLLKETDLEFESHVSGYVYKVKLDGKTYIKKEIPGPHTVDEFLYEINGLFSLRNSKNVIKFGGVVVDAEETRVLGLIIDFAAKGALIDILFEFEKTIPWSVRENWAREIVEGLSEIHEAGYVQGDFTLSNIVVDGDNKAKIIDINRRGCPVGWEPPELKPMIQSYQRIAMYIGVKSDLFQLGMVLWGLMMQDDEPERAENKPLTCDQAPSDIPDYFKKMIQVCLSDDPQGRLSAKELSKWFPPAPTIQDVSPTTSPTHASFPAPTDPSRSTPPPSQTHLPMDQQNSGPHNQKPLTILPYSPNPSTNGAPSSSGYIDGDRENSERFSDYVDVTSEPSAASVYSVEGGYAKVGSGNSNRVDSGFCEDSDGERGRGRQRKDGPDYNSGGGVGLGVIMEKDQKDKEGIVPVKSTGQSMA